MLTVLFTILMLLVFGKLLIFAVKAAWGVSKIIVSIVLLPLLLVGLVLNGLIFLALPILFIAGIIIFFITA